nr:MAG TPA: hypothetical protein [Caudoviricetes sp.]
MFVIHILIFNPAAKVSFFRICSKSLWPLTVSLI